MGKPSDIVQPRPDVMEKRAKEIRGARLAQARQLILNLMNLQAVIHVTSEEACRVDLPVDSAMALQRAGDSGIFTSQVNAHVKEIASIIWEWRHGNPGAWPPTKDEEAFFAEQEKLKQQEAAAVPTYYKHKKHDISDRLAETLAAIELMVGQDPDGTVAINDTYNEFGQHISRQAWDQRIKKLIEKKYIVKSISTVHPFPAIVRLSDEYPELKKTMAVFPAPGERPHGEKRQDQQQAPPSPPPPPPAPRLEEPDMLNGLPYTPSSELRNHLGSVIGALETLKEHLGPTLCLLLDLDRDFDRYTKVREGLEGLKKQLAGVGI